MAQQRTPRLGLLELVGIGFATGVSAGTVASYALGGPNLSAPCTGALGAALLPVLWLGVASPVLRAFWARARRRVPVTQGGHVAA